MTQRYDLIFIDSDETIVDFNRCQSAAFEALCTKFFPSVNALELYPHYQQINRAVWKRHHAGEISKDALKTIRFEETFGDSISDIASCISFYEDQLAQQTHFMPNAHNVLKLLSMHCKLVVVTNGFGHVHRTRFLRAGIASLFSGVVVSSDFETENYRKPHASIFHDAHTRFAPNTPKNRILMVGDSEDIDILGGINYQIDSCLFSASVTKDIPTAATYRITNWQELPMIIGIPG